MSIPDDLITVFSAHLEERDGAYVVELPEREVSLGTLEAGETYRVAVLNAAAADVSTPVEAPRRSGDAEPPVEEGETRTVHIEDIGEQGDGIARVGPGYIVFVPETDVGDEVTVEITDVRENFAFGEIAESEESESII